MDLRFSLKSHTLEFTLELSDMGESLNLLDENHQRDETINKLNSMLQEIQYKLASVEESFNSSKKSHATEIYHLNEKMNVLNQDCQTLLHNERVLLERYGNLEKHLSEIKEENQFLE